MNKTYPPLVVITGPTAAGKSSIALELAKKFEASIISADSVAIYKGFDIGSSKPSSDELNQVPHYLVSEKEPLEEFNAGVFVKEAYRAIEKISELGQLPIVAGGTGLYIRALVNGISEIPEVTDAAREEFEAKSNQFFEQPGGLHTWLAEVDPATANRLEPTDLLRIERALLVFLSSGVPISKWQQVEGQTYPGSVLVLALIPEREMLYKRINQRVLEMLELGLLDEVKELRAANGVDCKPLKSIGYGQVLRHLDGELSYEQMVREIQRDTRRFAKRQLTWFRNEPPKLGWVELKEDSEAAVADLFDGLIAQFIESKGRFATPGKFFMGISR